MSCCLACPVGRYADADGALECVDCPKGFYTNDAVGFAECTGMYFYVLENFMKICLQTQDRYMF